MKFARFTDMPILVKMGVAPACAALMVAVAATAMLSIEARQSSELKRIVQTDLPVSLRLKTVAERITAAHGRLYMLMTHQAAEIDTAKVSDQMAELLALPTLGNRDAAIACRMLGEELRQRPARLGIHRIRFLAGDVGGLVEVERRHRSRSRSRGLSLGRARSQQQGRHAGGNERVLHVRLSP